MLVIHPKDKTTAMLSALYEGLEAQVVDDCRSTKEMGHLLHHVSTQERIMLLGHGSDKGLFFRKDDSKNEFDLLDYVSRLMHEVGVPASIRGYDYIRDSIMLALTDRDILRSITKELYPSIAKTHSTTPSRVERAIRHAVEVAWSRGDVDVLNGIFGYTVKSSKGKPTNGEFISMLAERVRLDLRVG